MKRHLLFLVGMFFFGLIYAQNDLPQTLKTALVPSTYSRNAVTVVVLDHDACKYKSDIQYATNAMLIPDKYDDNSVAIRTLSTSTNKDRILEAINSSQLGNQILAKWFSRSSDGTFDMGLIAERGMYNATVDDMVKASASKIGMDRIRDAGKALVNNSYVQVIAFEDVISMEEYYDNQDAERRRVVQRDGKKFEPVSRTQNGWKGSAVSYLFKIDPNYVDILFNDMWIYEDDEEETKAEKIALFDEAEFKFSYVMNTSHSAEGIQDNLNTVTGKPEQKSREELFAMLLNNGITTGLYGFEGKYEPFRVKTVLYARKPLRAKIGTKEGLCVEDRYYVYENVMDKGGRIKSKRKGVVFTKKAANNTFVASTDSDAPMSRFYQVSGRKLEPGMTLQQRKSWGLALSGGYGFGMTDQYDMGGGYVKLEGNLGTLVNMVRKTVIPVTQLRVFGTVAFDNGYYLGSDISFLRYEVGFSKGFYFWRNFSVAPFIAYGVEGTEYSAGTINGDFLNTGAYLSINMLKNIQLVTTFNFYSFLGNAYYLDGDGDRINQSIKYQDRYDGREGASIDVGLRIEF